MRMVREFGLSTVLGPVAFGDQRSAVGPIAGADCSEATRRIIDTEVEALLKDAEQRAVHLLDTHRRELGLLVDELVEHETVAGDVVARIAGVPSATAPAVRTSPVTPVDAVTAAAVR